MYKKALITLLLWVTGQQLDKCWREHQYCLGSSVQTVGVLAFTRRDISIDAIDFTNDGIAVLLWISGFGKIEAVHTIVATGLCHCPWILLISVDFLNIILFNRISSVRALLQMFTSEAKRCQFSVNRKNIHCWYFASIKTLTCIFKLQKLLYLYLKTNQYNMLFYWGCGSRSITLLKLLK